MSISTPTNDFFERLRRTVVPPLGTVVQFINELGGLDLYVTGSSRSNEFVGRVAMSEEAFEKELEVMGLTRNPLASLKKLPSTGEVEEGSFRWVPGPNDSRDQSKQLHVIIYDGSDIPDADTGYTYVYSHWEYRWDTHPIKHYRAVDQDIEQGVEMMQNKLDAHGTEYDDVPPSGE
jgi:hypothetical protein